MHTTRHRVCGDIYDNDNYLYEYEAFITVVHDSELHPFGSTTAEECTSEPIDSTLSIFIKGKLTDLEDIFDDFGKYKTEKMLDKIYLEAR